MIQIQDKFLNIPLIQGGMGVGVSLSSLAGNVAKCGGMGVISAAHPGYNFEGFRKDPTATSCRAIKYHIQRAKEIAEGKGLIGVNIMVAGNGYEELVKASVEGGCDAIISGAGLPLDLPKYAKGKALLAPIVSSGKAARLIAKVWEKRYQYTPDFVVIEGSKAGGHLGFKKEDLLAGTCQKLEDILEDVKKELAPFQEKFKKSIPIFVAGGIDCGKKIAEFIKRGASGVQIATPFIATYECDASQEFKDMVINATKEDIELVKSPTGFPGRAIVNEFVKKTRNRGNVCMKSCLDCMIPCNPSDTPYCISEALIQSVSGNVNNGLVFVGIQAADIHCMKHVHELIQELMQEMEDNL